SIVIARLFKYALCFVVICLSYFLLLIVVKLHSVHPHCIAFLDSSSLQLVQYACYLQELLEKGKSVLCIATCVPEHPLGLWSLSPAHSVSLLHCLREIFVDQLVLREKLLLEDDRRAVHILKLAAHIVEKIGNPFS